LVIWSIIPLIGEETGFFQRLYTFEGRKRGQKGGLFWFSNWEQAAKKRVHRCEDNTFSLFIGYIEFVPWFWEGPKKTNKALEVCSLCPDVDKNLGF